MDDDSSTGVKRQRDQEETCEENGSPVPESKRLHSTEVDDDDDHRHGKQDLVEAVLVNDHHERDLRFLLEASDDELGLPPVSTSGSVSSSPSVSSSTYDTWQSKDNDDENEDFEGFGKLWSLEEDAAILNCCYHEHNVVGEGGLGFTAATTFMKDEEDDEGHPLDWTQEIIYGQYSANYLSSSSRMDNFLDI